MLKITLPNGVSIEGDMEELVPLFKEIINDPPKSTPVSSAPVQPVVQVKDTVELPVADSEPTNYPHRYAPNGKRAVTVGERGDQVLQAAKMLAEENENRSNEFTSREVLEMIDSTLNISTISSALQSLVHHGLIRRGSNHRRWYVTEKGWNSYYRIGQPTTIKSVRPTT